MASLPAQDIQSEVANEGKIMSTKDAHHNNQIERVDSNDTQNLVYDLADEEPDLHFKTYIAVASMVLANFVQVFALQGPPTVLSFIGTSLHGSAQQTWVPNALSLVQAVLTPIISSASDIFQARKYIMVTCYIISFVGCAIAPGAEDIYRVIGAQIMIGAGFSCVALVYTVPSEVLPKKWRPIAQASINVAASLGACIGPVAIGALTKADTQNGWKNFYWIQMGLWGLVALGVFFAYQPPSRHTRLDHLSFWQKLGHLDLLGCAQLTFGLTLLLTGLSLGGNLYAWGNARVMVLLVAGILFLGGFGIYEWKGTKTGIVHHDLLRNGKSMGRTFALCVILIMIENVVAFGYLVFYPTLTNFLFTQDPLVLAARLLAFWGASGLSTLIWGYSSSRFRTIRAPLVTGFAVFTAANIGMSTIQPGQSANSLAFAAMAGIGFGCPLVLVIAGVHLSTPHHLMATATGLTCAARAVAGTLGTAIYAAALTTRLQSNVPEYTAKATLAAGLPSSSLQDFLGAFLSHNSTALPSIPGVDSEIIAAASTALLQADADSIRVIYIIGTLFAALGAICALFLGDLKQTMTFRVDAPVEKLHAKQNRKSLEMDTRVHAV